MSKTVFTLELPPPRVRKKRAPTAKAHADKHAYTRKRKHKADYATEAPANAGVLV